MFGIGSEELFIIIIFSLLVFDPDKLPDAGRRLGRAFRYFRKTKQDVQDVVQKEVIEPLNVIEQKASSEVEKIDQKLTSGSFEELFAKSEMPREDSAKSNSKTSQGTHSASHDPSVQKMTNLLYGIDDGEEDTENK